MGLVIHLIPVDNYDQFADAANELLDTIYPAFKDGAVFARYDLGGMDTSVKPFVGPLLNNFDNLATMLSKWLQLLDKATDSNGNFYIIAGVNSEPYVDVPPKKTFVVPQYHPPGDRRYWNRAYLDNPNPHP